MPTRDQGKRGMQFEVSADDTYVYKTLHTIEKSAANGPLKSIVETKKSLSAHNSNIWCSIIFESVTLISSSPMVKI